MRIGMFTYSTRPRGSVVHAACLAEALQAHGHEVTLFALAKAGDGFFRQLGCRVCLLPAGEAPEPMDRLIRQRIEELVSGLARVSPGLDLLHAQDCLAASGLLEAKRRGAPWLGACPIVRTVHHVERFESPYLAECQQRSITESDLLLSVSQVTQSEVQAEFGRTSERVQNGVDFQRFSPIAEAERQALRTRLLDLHAGAFVALSVGGVEARKNSLRSLRAMAVALAAHPELHWVIVGGHSLFDHRDYRHRFDGELWALAPSERARVHLLGPLPDANLQEWYRASDVLLCPSEREGWGLCVMEALASGLPVITANEAPFTEYLDPSASRFVDPLDSVQIERALSELIESPQARAELARRGRRCIERFTWAASAARHSQLYARALAAAPPPRRYQSCPRCISP